MRTHLLVKLHLYIETAPCYFCYAMYFLFRATASHESTAYILNSATLRLCKTLVRATVRLNFWLVGMIGIQHTERMILSWCLANITDSTSNLMVIVMVMMMMMMMMMMNHDDDDKMVMMSGTILYHINHPMVSQTTKWSREQFTSWDIFYRMYPTNYLIIMNLAK